MAHVAAYITGHGFGHATRVAAVLSALAARVPGLRLTLVSTAPEWLFRLNLAHPFAFRARALDVGVIQHDALRVEKEATLDAYAAFLAGQPALVEAEAAALAREGVDLVLADIPPAAFLVAERAGVPGIGLSNFTWDWIYTDYAREFPAYRPILEAIRAAYARASLFLRLPFHGPCDPFPVRRDVPLVARRAHGSREAVRAALGLVPARPAVLLSFGGFEAQTLDLAALAALADFDFITTQMVPAGAPNVRRAALNGLHYEELVAAVDVVVTKPGYGIVSDCLANRTRVLYTSRGAFAEYDRLVAGLEIFGVAQFIDNEALLAGRWGDALAGLLARPARFPGLATDGAEVVAGILESWLSRAPASGQRRHTGERKEATEWQIRRRDTRPPCS